MKIKLELLISLLLFGQIIFGQTEKFTRVPGTKCGLIPPVGFITATAFSGFHNAKKGASIMINELPAPYQSLVDGFTADALKTKGITLVSKNNIDFNGAKAIWMTVTQQASGTTFIKQMLIFGDAKGTILVNGIYPEASKEIELEIKEAILSTVYDTSQIQNPLDAVTFTIDIKETDFKLVNYMSGMLLYSTDGKIPTKKPTFIIGNSIAKIPLQNQKKYAEERLKKLPQGDKSEVNEINEVNIDNLNGYEIVAEGKTEEGKAELIYQVMLFNEKGDYYIFVGQTAEEFDKYLKSFRNIATTFKRK